ncbi:MAG: AMIN domain-containing protein [Pseudomonadota bacterium]|nr:AMIN domain-containing protein [Pseudomonadota bacterium]
MFRLAAVVMALVLAWMAGPLPSWGSAASTREARRHPPSSEKPIDVKAISLQIDSDRETLRIVLDRFHVPAISRLEGGNPRLVVDLHPVGNVSPERAARVTVNGRLIKQMRSYHDRRKSNLRIVLDMEPNLNYLVKPVFVKARRLLLLEIREDGGK